MVGQITTINIPVANLSFQWGVQEVSEHFLIFNFSDIYIYILISCKLDLFGRVNPLSSIKYTSSDML